MPDLEMLPSWAGRIENRRVEPPMPPKASARTTDNDTAAPTDEARPPAPDARSHEESEPDHPTLLNPVEPMEGSTTGHDDGSAPAPFAPAASPSGGRLGTTGLVLVSVLILAAGVGAGYLYTVIIGG